MEQSYRLGGGAFPTLIAIISMFFVGVSGVAFDSMLSALLLTLFIVLNIINSRTGRAIMAIRDNRKPFP